LKLHRFLRVSLVTIALMAAFAAGQWRAASSSAQTRQKWEYQVLKVELEGAGAAINIKGLTARGDEGWEVAAMNSSWVILKRMK
jgi:hypothetical protein